MKKSIMFLLVFLITLAGAFATIEVTDVKLGGDSQQRGETASVDVSVKNAGATTLSDFNVSFSGVAAKYNAKAVSVPSTIAPGATAVVKVQALVPLDFDAVDADGKKTAFNIGNVVFDGNNGSNQVKTVTLSMEAENNLKFTSTRRIKFGDEDEKLRDGKTYDNVNRGDTVTLEVEIENSFSDNDDCQDDGTNCDIENIELNLKPNDSDFDDDSDDMSDISAEDEDATTLSFDVPDDIDEDKYDFDMYVLGEDENGALHGELMTFTLDIEVEKNEITITEATLTPTSLECRQTRATLRVEVENTGKNDQNDASIFIESDRLDITDEEFDIEIDEGDSVTKTFEIAIPQGAEPGTYYINVRSNYDYDKESDTQSVSLKVNDCVTDNVPDDNDDNNANDDSDDVVDDSNTDVQVIEVPTTPVVVDDKKDSDFFESPQYIMMLGALFLVALLIFFILIVLLLKK